MKVVILAGGYGTRLSEETYKIPKPMVEIGEKPILWHIMKIFYSQGFDDFIICGGYKQHVIKEFFSNYTLKYSDFEFDFKNNEQRIINAKPIETWNVKVLDTGLKTMTGGRIKRIKEYLDEKFFLLTYGDGLSNIDVQSLIESHNKSGKLATLSAVQVDSKYGNLDIDSYSNIKSFDEKKSNFAWINGGFMVLERSVLDLIKSDKNILEKDLLARLAKENQLNAYMHFGFWKSMDTLKDKNSLNDLWLNNEAEWKIWNE